MTRASRNWQLRGDKKAKQETFSDEGEFLSSRGKGKCKETAKAESLYSLDLAPKLADRFVSVSCFRVCEGYRFVGGQRMAAADAALREENSGAATHN